MGGGGSQTTTTETEPWVGQQPYLTDLFQQGQSLFDQGGRQYFPGSTVAPFAPQSQMAFDMMTNRALMGDPTQTAFGNMLGQQLGQSNFDPSAIFDPAQAATGGLGSAAQMFDAAGMGAAGMGQPNQMVGDAADALGGMTGFGSLGEARQYAGNPLSSALPASEQEFIRSASGQYLGSNPYLDAMFDTAAGRAGEAFNEQVMPGIAAQFGGAGRTGSGIHQQMGENAARQFGRDLQGMAADIYAPAYESERDRMLTGAAGGTGAFSALNQADLGRLGLGSNLYLGERGLGQQGANMLGNLGLGQGQLGLGGINALTGAGQGMAGLGQTGLGALGDLYGQIGQNQFRAGALAPTFRDMQYGDMDRLLGVGGAMEDQSQRLIEDAFNRFNFGQNQPYQNLQDYANIIYGLPGGYGTSTQDVPTGSRGMGALGGGLLSGGLGYAMGLSNPIIGAMMLGGGLLGGM